MPWGCVHMCSILALIYCGCYNICVTHTRRQHKQEQICLNHQIQKDLWTGSYWSFQRQPLLVVQQNVVWDNSFPSHSNFWEHLVVLLVTWEALSYLCAHTIPDLMTVWKVFVMWLYRQNKSPLCCSTSATNGLRSLSLCPVVLRQQVWICKR